MVLSEKLSRILRSNTVLSELDINNLTERQGWDIVYSLKQKTEPKTEICFTGFSPIEKGELTKLAQENNFHIAKSITVNLNFLCYGENAGPAKMKKAEEQNVIILNADEFRDLIETGEIPR
jgi:BRCT domain type II-containing protein